MRINGKTRGHHGAVRPCLLYNSTLFVITTAGLYSVDVSEPSRPRVLQKLEELRNIPSYFDLGSGAHDLDADGKYLFVACGQSRYRKGFDTSGTPKVLGIVRDHHSFSQYVTGKEDYFHEKSIRGGVHILDISNPSDIKTVKVIDDELIGCGPVTSIDYEDGYLYLCCRLVGVVIYDVRDIENPRYCGKISTMGEVEYARLVGDKLYAVSNGLYVIKPYPVEEAEVLGFCWTSSWMFGRGFCMNPSYRYNPGRVMFVQSGRWHRQLSVANPRRPLVTRHDSLPLASGQWLKERIFVNIENPKREREVPKGFAVYRIDRHARLTCLFKFQTTERMTHIIVRGRYAYLMGLFRDRKRSPEKPEYLNIFDISEPTHPRLVGKYSGPTDTGGMQSPAPFLKDDLLYLPGWFSGSYLGGGGWGNFLGIRVVDVSNPSRPRMHTLIHYIPPDISVNSLSCPNSFYVANDTLYVADYWTGLHIFDIKKLRKKRLYEHIACLKDPFLPWSCSSYATSVTGYGRYIFVTHFGSVDFYEIPVNSDLPVGELSIWFRPTQTPEKK